MDFTTTTPINHATDRLEFLAGGGEMGRLIAWMDWAPTPLGAPASWPQSLRTAAAWGVDPTQIHNDGYWPICIQKHPISVGQNDTARWESAGSRFHLHLEGSRS